MSALTDRSRPALAELSQELEIPHTVVRFLSGEITTPTVEDVQILRPWIPTETWLELFRRGKLGRDFQDLVISSDPDQIKTIFHRHPLGTLEKWYALKRLIALLV